MATVPSQPLDLSGWYRFATSPRLRGSNPLNSINAQAVHIDPINGIDAAGRGAAGQPFKTLQYAQNNKPAELDNHFYIRGNVTFSESWTEFSVAGIHVLGSGTSASDMYVIEAYPGETPVLDQQAAANGFNAFNKSFFRIKGLEITNCYGTIAEDKIAGVFTKDCSSFEILSNHIHSINGQAGGNVGGVRTDGSYNGVIENNKIHNIRVGGVLNNNGACLHGFGQYNIQAVQNTLYDAQRCIYHKDSAGKAVGDYGYTVLRNVMHTAAEGFYADVAGGNSLAHNLQVLKHNIFYAITGTAVELDASDPADNNAGIEFINNVIDSDAALANGLWINDSDSVIQRNNIFYRVLSDTLRLQGPHTITESDFNCYYNNNEFVRYLFNVGGTEQTYSTLADWQGQGFDANSSQSDPLFVDAANRDYRLQNNSSLLTAGKDGVAVGAYLTGNEQIGSTL